MSVVLRTCSSINGGFQMKIKRYIKLIAKQIMMKSKNGREAKQKVHHLSLVANNKNIKHLAVWESAFTQFLSMQPEEAEVVETFYMYPLEIVHERQFDIEKPIVISIQKNELYRVNKFLEYYRKLGIDQFAIIDNSSSDGSFEMLYSQEDVSLYRAKEAYRTNRREGWMNQIIDRYGFNRWYIIVDIDELLSYIGIEDHPIQELIKEVSKLGISRVRGMLVDMYPMSFNDADNQVDPYVVYRYFDTKTYTELEDLRLSIVRGGFRKRIFGSNAMLTKYPVLYLREGDVHGKSHFPFPYRKNYQSQCYIALLHYKFLQGEINKYKEIVKKGNYYQGSQQYKDYIRVLEKEESWNMVLCDEQSNIYTCSNDLSSIGALSKIDFNKK